MFAARTSSALPATGERTEQGLLVQMFNIHLIREPWRDLPTAKALGRLMDEIRKGTIRIRLINWADVSILPAIGTELVLLDNGFARLGGSNLFPPE